MENTLHPLFQNLEEQQKYETIMNQEQLSSEDLAFLEGVSERMEDMMHYEQELDELELAVTGQEASLLRRGMLFFRNFLEMSRTWAETFLNTRGKIQGEVNDQESIEKIRKNLATE